MSYKSRYAMRLVVIVRKFTTRKKHVSSCQARVLRYRRESLSIDQASLDALLVLHSRSLRAKGLCPFANSHHYKRPNLRQLLGIYSYSHSVAASIVSMTVLHLSYHSFLSSTVSPVHFYLRIWTCSSLRKATLPGMRKGSLR
jgi:hypothetical protein